MARYIEPFGHVLAIGYPLVTGSLAVVYNAFNPMPVLPGWCWFQEYPQKCSSIPNLECLRGHDTPFILTMVGSLPCFATIFGIILVSMGLIILTVRETEQRMQRYAGSVNHQNYERTKEVAYQALLYMGAFILTYFPIAALQVAGNSSSKNFAFALLVKSLSTLQGLFNAIIFLRNQYQTLTAQGQSLYCLRHLLNRTRHPPASTAAVTSAATLPSPDEACPPPTCYCDAGAKKTTESEKTEGLIIPRNSCSSDPVSA